MARPYLRGIVVVDLVLLVPPLIPLRTLMDAVLLDLSLRVQVQSFSCSR